jgi:hypothetical protein
MSSKARQERVKSRITGIFRITRALLLVLVIITALFASVQAAEAAGNATKLVIFTDKKVYKDFYIQHGRQSSNIPAVTDADDIDNLVVYSYAIVLDDDGNIMKGLSGITGILDDTRRLDHYHKGTNVYHHDETLNPNFYNNINLVYNDAGTSGDGIAGDGIYTAYADIADSTTATAADILDDHLVFNISATYGSLTSYTEVLYSAQGCHNGETESHGTHTGADSATKNNVPCTMCHRGYEHLYESQSGTFPDSMKDVHALNMTPATPSVYAQSITIDWNLSKTTGTSWSPTTWSVKMPGSEFCYSCHFATSGGGILDYGAGGRTDFADRPSCSQASVTTVGGGTVSCHATSEIEKVPVVSWSQAAAAGTATSLNDIWKAKSHNRTNPANVSCALCHGTPAHGLTMPNMSADISYNGAVNDQCSICHDISNGFLNIISNGGNPVKHENPNCKACHYSSTGKLDAHKVPVGQFGGPNCTSCHDAGSPNPYHVDINVMNSSDYIHYNLNNGSNTGPSPRWENRMCWACHSNDSVGADDVVNYNELPLGEHPEGYLADHDCAYCHINTVGGGYHFGAMPNVEHNWYPGQYADDDIFTPGIDSCEDCHADPNMLNNSFQDTDFGAGMSNRSNATAENASKAAHYNKKQTWLRDILHGTEPGDYCRYCHQNMSTFAPYSNPDNKARSEHAPKDTTPSCTESLCHGEFALHDEGLTEPHITEGNTTESYCTVSGCHDTGYEWHNDTLSCVDCHIGNLSEVDVGGRIHPIHYINFNGGYMTAKEGAALCSTCHTDNNETYEAMFGVSIPTVLDQSHSEDPQNGSIWNESWGNRQYHPGEKFWDYTPTYESIVNLTQSTFTSGTWYNITKGTGAEKLDMVNRTWGYETTDYTPGVNNEPDAEIFTSNQNFDNGSFNWTGTVNAAPGGTITNYQEHSGGNPYGYIYTKYDEGGGGSSTGIGTWTAVFGFNGENAPSQYINASLSFDFKSEAATSNTYEFILKKPDSSTVTLYSETVGDVSSWTSRQMYLNPNNFTQNGNYSISIKSTLPGNIAGIKMDYDNVRLTLNKYGNYKYNATFVVPDVEYQETLQLVLSYQVNIEPANLSIYNSSTGQYGYRREINKTADEYIHLNLTAGEWNSGTVMFRIEDTQRGVDNTQDNVDLAYIFVLSDTGTHLPCEYCHYPNKHYRQAVGAPVAFAGNNQVEQGMDGTWCASCHYDRYVNGSAVYYDMVRDFNETQGFSVPPEISGNETWGNFTGTSVESKYRDHEAEGWISEFDYNDQKCTSCHSKGAYYTEIKSFMHSVKIGTSGGLNCSACHDINGEQKNVNFTAVSLGMHGNLNSGATASGGNASNKACWACHGTIIGEYANESDQPEGGHNSTYYSNPRKCEDCHNDISPVFGAKAVTDHIPSGISASTDVSTSSYNNTYCGYCHNNSVVPNFDPDGFGKTGGSPTNASSSHYGANKTKNMLMDAGSNSNDCVYCHINSNNMQKWGILPASLSNISNKDGTGGTGFNHNPYTQSGECYTCHGGTVSTFHESAMSPGEKGNPDCESCHNISGGYAGVDFTAINNSVHGSLNSGATSSAGNISNKPCWACHGTKTGIYANESDQPVNDHDSTYKSSPRVCEDCHINGSVLFNAPGLTEHIMPGKNESTEINVTDGYCTVCHNNSITANNDNDGMGILSAINASSAHYASDANANLMTGTQHSDNCTYCHFVNNESAEWLTPRKPLTSTHTSLSGATPASTCWGCHTDSKGEPSTFHVQEINKGAGSGPDCRSCHNISDSDAGRGHIDANVFDNSIHGGMNTTSGVDSNEPCWACHGNGESEGHNETGDSAGKGMFSNPYNCTDCHTSTGVRYGWATARGAMTVEEHFSGATDIVASYNAITTYSCLMCHQDVGEMRLSNSDPDNNKTVWSSGGDTYNSTIGGSNSPYHYGRKRTDIRTGTNTSCVYCHQNSSSVFPLSDTNKSIFEHTSSGTKNTTGPDCTDSNCHAAGLIHNSSLAKPAVQAWTGGSADYCAPCHESGNSGASKYVYAHNTNNISIVNMDCGYCHNASSQGIISSGSLNLHTGKLTNSSLSNETCAACHRDSNYVGASRVINTHYPGASTDKGNTSESGRDCEDCHGLTVGNSMHASGMVNKPADGCLECHKTKSSIYNATTAKATIGSYAHDKSAWGNDTADCNWCHNNTNDPQDFHFTQWANGTISNPSAWTWTAGDTPDCIDCHNNNTGSPFYANVPAVDHTDNINDSTWGVDDCYKCHTSAGTYASDPKAMHFIDPAPANANCTQCHDTNGEASKQVDVDAMNNSDSIHLNLNSGAANGGAVEPYAAESKRCWACHGNGTAPTTHPANFKNPYLCEDCHTTGGAQYSNYTAAYVIDHIQTGLDISTDVRTNDYCTACHNNSIAAIINDPNLIDAVDIVSHYGTNASLMTASNDSLDCKYCHMDNSNNVTWGNATYFTEHQGTTTASPNSECYTCHNTSASVPIANLHATEMDAGKGAGPDCIACHDVPSGPKSYGLIDFTVSNSSGAIHKMLNENATSSYDMANYQCWGCHGNGTEPASGEHPANYKNPYLCEDCHVSGGSRFTWAASLPVPALAVDEHYSGASQISASVNANITQSCLKCHEDTAEMVLGNADTDTASGWVGDNYNINGGNTSPYHYGSKRSDLTPDTDAYCNYCHNNASASSEWIWVDSTHNTTIREHTTDGSANLTNATTLNCADCHSTGRLHNSTLTTPAVSGWGGASNSVCAPCHETGGSGSLMKVASHNTTTTGITDCSECHNSENPGVSGGYQGVHSGNLTQGATAGYETCTGCHTDAGTIFVTNSIKTHYKGASAGKANTATYECEQCHNLGIGTSMHTDGMTIPAEGCNECHNDIGSTTYDSTILVQNLNHDNSSYGGAVTCDTCHNTVDEPGNFHFTDYPNGTVQNTSWKSPGVLVNCIDCHTNYSGSLPYSAEPTSYHKGTYGSSLDECYDCHTSAAAANDANAPEAMHNVTVSSVWDNCTDCHAPTAKNGAPVMDNTQIGTGIHKGLNGGGNDACTACHGASVNHYSTAKNCDYCHMNGSDVFNSLQVTEHYPSAPELLTYPAQGDNDSCITCHNETEMVLEYTDDSPGTGIAIVSHYARIRTDMGSGDAYCNYCHSNTTSAFVFDNAANKAVNEHTTNTSASINNISMSCGSCHASGRIHNSTLTTPVAAEWTVAAGDYCAPCHMPADANATLYVYNQGHDPNYSQSDRIEDCGFCHNQSSQGINGSTLRIHSDKLVNGTAVQTYSTCKGCHNGTGIFTGTGKQLFSHIPDASGFRGNTSMSGYTCEYCHNLSGKPSMHSAGMDSSNGDCDTCHFTRTSLFNSTQKIVSGGDYNHTYSGQVTCNVSQCHNASGESPGFHLDKYAAGTIADPERINSVWNDRNYAGNGFTDTPYVDCIDCHREHNDTAPFTNSPGYEANITGEDLKVHTPSDSIDTCYNCHTNRTDAADRYMVHNVTIEPLEGGPACVKCHNQSAPVETGFASINNRVNITAFQLSVHKNFINSTAWNTSKTTGSVLLDSACWACHVSDINNVPANSHPDRGGPSAKRPYQCRECHTVGGNVSNFNLPLYQNATKVYRHYAGTVFTGAIVFNSSKECHECHRNGVFTDTNISYGSYQYTEPANVSHYGDRSSLITTDSSRFACTETCHALGPAGGDLGGVYGNAVPVKADHNKMGTVGEECLKGCHNSNPVTNIILHSSNMGIYVGMSTCFSEGCHTAPPVGDNGGRRR